MIEYVSGLLIDHPKERVVLIRKNKPERLAGKLTGVGGKIDPGETMYQAMQREFIEEAGCNISDWHHVCTLEGIDHRIFFFRYFVEPIELFKVRSMEAEVVDVYSIDQILADKSLVSNMRWVLPLCLDPYVQHPALIKNGPKAF